VKVGDVAVAGGDEVAGRGVGAGLVVDEDARDLDARNVLVHEDDIAAPADELGEGAVVGRVGHHDETVDVTIVEAIEAGDLAMLVAARRGHEDGVAVTLGLFLDRRSQFGEEGLADFGDDEADGFGLAGREALGEEVGAVVEALDRGIDPRRGGGRKLDAIVEIARDRGGRDPRVLCDVVNGDGHGTPARLA
jgi:hypothetical protein